MIDPVELRVFLDDERRPSAGWRHVRWPDEAIELLKTGAVIEISLDHDLGNDSHGTGYDVLLWKEHAVACERFVSPGISVHTANPAARLRMLGAVAEIARLSGGQDAYSVSKDAFCAEV